MLSYEVFTYCTHCKSLEPCQGISLVITHLILLLLMLLWQFGEIIFNLFTIEIIWFHEFVDFIHSFIKTLSDL